MSNQAAIQQLQRDIRKAKRTLRREVEKANRDNIITPSEQADIDFIEDTIADLENQLYNLENNITEVEFTDEEAGTITVEAPPEWGPTDPVRLHFNNQMQDWTSQVRAELNAIHTQHNDTQPDTEFGLNEVLALAGLIPEIGKYASALATIKSVTEKFLKAAMSSSKVTFNQLHSDMDDAFSNYYKHDYEEEFQAFKADFERQHEIYSKSDVTAAITAMKADLPVKEIGQQLVSTLLDNVPDGYDLNSYAGVLEMEIKVHIPVIRGDYSFPSASGYIDDANEALLNATKHAFKNKRAIDLPIPVIITIVDPFNRNTMVCKLKRNSKEPGNTDFRMIDYLREDQGERIFEKFKEFQPYTMLKVKHLKVE